MTRFVGAEYLIASILISKAKKRKKSTVSMQELSKYGICVQRMSIQSDIDAVFLTSKVQFYNAVYDFSDYFQYETDDDDRIISISVQKESNIHDVESRFMGYLTKEISDLLFAATEKYNAA